MASRIHTIFLILPCAFLLSNCGEQQLDRAISGAAIGAGIGAMGSIWVSGNPFAGILIGGAAGAVTGAVTTNENINLGTPIWRLY
jgi:hypothetical protein